MVGEILFSLALVAIWACLVTTIFVVAPCFDELFKKRKSNTVTVADKEKLYEQNHRNFQGIRDPREGAGIIGLSGSSSKGDDKELFSGVHEESKVDDIMPVGEILDELSERVTLSSQIREEQEERIDETPLSYSSRNDDGVSEPKAKRQKGSEVFETDKLNTERAGYHEEEERFIFDDWEGIERTELERLFGKAVAFVSSKSNADILDSNLKLQLYGLHKVATEGPCHESRPIPLKLSARSKWNAWQRLGSMDMDMAMEQYISLLSKSIPDWEER